METIQERLFRLRKTLNVSQTDFAARLGISRSAVCKIESGENAPSEQTIRMTCAEYNVNESWLRSGEGEMFRPVSRDEEIAAFIGDILSETPDFRRRFVAVLARMTPAEWELLEKKARELLEDTKKDG